MSCALATTEAPTEDREVALARIAYENEIERNRQKPSPAVRLPYPVINEKEKQ